MKHLAIGLLASVPASILWVYFPLPFPFPDSSILISGLSAALMSALLGVSVTGIIFAASDWRIKVWKEMEWSDEDTH